MLTTRPRGTNDILPGEVEKWQAVEECFRQLCREYGYGEIRTPLFEHTELFDRGVGDDTDIVEKEMYTFRDRSNRSLSLRPEGTAAAARAYLESGLNAGPQPVKLFYTGPMFRYASPQAGRYRQFHQVGVEVFGSPRPAVDAEVIAMAMDFYARLELPVELHLNSVGCPNCRPGLREKLTEYFRGRQDDLCADCRRRLATNPLRALDCKVPRCRELAQNAPAGLEYLCAECAAHFQDVQKYLDALGIACVIDRFLVRGLDYYTKTAFEMMVPGIGAQNSVGGGGRYDNLVETIGGPPTPGIGYAIGLERVLLALREQGSLPPDRARLDVFLAAVDTSLESETLKLLQTLRQNGLAADKDWLGRSLKAQMKYAGKTGAPAVVIVGRDELAKGMVILRDMAAGTQREVPVAGLAEEIVKLRRKGSTR